MFRLGLDVCKLEPMAHRTAFCMSFGELGELLMSLSTCTSRHPRLHPRCYPLGSMMVTIIYDCRRDANIRQDGTFTTQLWLCVPNSMLRPTFAQDAQFAKSKAVLGLVSH